MGINSFKAEQRSLDATDGEGRTVSLDILTSGNAAIESESGVKQNQGGEGVETAPAAGAMTIDAKSAVLMDAASGQGAFCTERKRATAAGFGDKGDDDAACARGC